MICSNPLLSALIRDIKTKDYDSFTFLIVKYFVKCTVKGNDNQEMVQKEKRRHSDY